MDFELPVVRHNVGAYKGEDNTFADQLSIFCQPVRLEARKTLEPKLTTDGLGTGKWDMLKRNVLRSQKEQELWGEIIQKNPESIISDKDGFTRNKQDDFWKIPIPADCAGDVI